MTNKRLNKDPFSQSLQFACRWCSHSWAREQIVWQVPNWRVLLKSQKGTLQCQRSFCVCRTEQIWASPGQSFSKWNTENISVDSWEIAVSRRGETSGTKPELSCGPPLLISWKSQHFWNPRFCPCDFHINRWTLYGLVKYNVTLGPPKWYLATGAQCESEWRWDDARRRSDHRRTLSAPNHSDALSLFWLTWAQAASFPLESASDQALSQTLGSYEVILQQGANEGTVWQ